MVKTRLAGLEKDLSEKDPQFPWKDFFKLLLPEIWLLLGAVVVSFSRARSSFLHKLE